MLPQPFDRSSISAPHPRIIQGGMGAGVSGWRLARAVSMTGQLGVVSGTALGAILTRQLQLGDSEGHIRRALAHFPIEGVANRILSKYFIAGGKPHDQPFRSVPMPSIHFSRELLDFTVAANFVEVFLAKEGHSGVVGINYLEKIQTPTLPSLFGAMLAGVDYVLVGAGVPRAIPGILDDLAKGQAVRLKIDVADLPPSEEVFSAFDPSEYCGNKTPLLKRPQFLAIVASATLAMALARKSSGRVDGFVVEGSSAGGHNAPPRGPLRLNERGEPVYGDADVADLEKIGALGLPFWLAGSYGTPEKLVEARSRGAAGIQVGTLFAFCAESAIAPELKRQVIEQAIAGTLEVFTDPTASPTGFPFKVVKLPGTLADPEVYDARTRMCDLGYLRSAYRKPDGSIGYRCSSEDEETFISKGGSAADTHGRKCLCNGLVATVGLGQVYADHKIEAPIVTSGDDIARIVHLAKGSEMSYTAGDVIRYLLGEEVTDHESQTRSMLENVTK
jgi:nitronate monooxygenase